MIPNWLERRIKIHVRSREHVFFAACAPGLEETVAGELTALGAEATEIFPGGVEFKGKMELMYRANLHLRSASRVWLRVDQFRVGAMEDLFRRTAAIRWETLIFPDAEPFVQVYLRSSRLQIPDQARKAVLDGIHARIKEVQSTNPDYGDAAGDGYKQMILVYVEKNQCRISLDSSGDHLHRRGYRLETAKAPIRETLAAGLILASDWTGEQPFLDPMCGAGTFPIEAALMARRVPPGINRNFGFMNWPVYSEGQWNFLVKEARAAILDTPPAPIFARDRNAGAIRISRANAARAGVEDSIRFAREDFFAPKAVKPAPGRGILFINAPYGRRIDKPGDDSGFAGRLGQRLYKVYKDWTAVVILPSGTAPANLGLKPYKTIHLDNGGIKVSALFIRL